MNLLFICTENRLRSPTAEAVFSEYPGVEAMALNNLGVAQLHSGNFEAAADALKGALAVDPQYPLPHFNLAIERVIAKDEEAAVEAVVHTFKHVRGVIGAVGFECGFIFC